MAVRDVVQAAAGVGGGGEYVEDVFSTYLFTGTGTTTAITNGIDLDGEGGLVWIKDRDSGAKGHALFDTERGGQYKLQTQWTGAQTSYNNIVFNSDGFTNDSLGDNNGSGTTFASWTWRKSPNFFDVVTYTGNGTSNRPIAHSLASVPGCIIIKSTGTVTNWMVWHRSLSVNNLLTLNSTAAQANYATLTIHDVTSTNFQVDNYSMLNASGVQYVAYLFAHDAGGFGDDGDQNVISCGSYTGTGVADNAVNIGWEPQWLLWKPATSTGDWQIVDAMRGFTASGVGVNRLEPNTSDAEALTGIPYCDISSTGFVQSGSSGTNNASGQTYIYIAIRRPMKTPESGTEVFAPIAYTTTDGSWQDRVLESNFTTDLAINGYRNISDGGTHSFVDRLRGYDNVLRSHQVNAESIRTSDYYPWPQTGQYVTSNEWSKYNGGSGLNYYNYQFKRATSFMDVVCYTGTGSNLTLPHNLTVAPELVIGKVRNTGSSWGVSTSTDWSKYLLLNSTNEQASASLFGTPDATNFYPTASGGFSGSGNTYVAYLFASLPGVSKVGSYTGTGADLNVDCGFSAGARFILIKRTDSTGDWYVWDSARGIVAGNDPYLLLNNPAPEVTTTDYIDPLSSGFTVTSSAPAALNASGGSYIFLAIA